MMGGALATILDYENEIIFRVWSGGELEVAQVPNFFVDLSTGLLTSGIHLHEKCTFILFQLDCYLCVCSCMGRGGRGVSFMQWNQILIQTRCYASCLIIGFDFEEFFQFG